MSKEATGRSITVVQHYFVGPIMKRPIRTHDRLRPSTELFFLLDESSDFHQTFGQHFTMLETRFAARPLFLYSMCLRDRLAA